MPSIRVMTLSYPRQINLELHWPGSKQVEAHRAVEKVGLYPLLALLDQALQSRFRAGDRSLNPALLPRLFV